MAIRTDQYTNSLTVVDTVTANAPLNLIPQGTAAVNIPGTGQNLITYSEQFQQANWFKSLCTVTADTSIAPNGTLTADTLASTSAGDVFIEQGTAVQGPVCYSFFAKQGGASPSAEATLRMITFAPVVLDTTLYFDFATRTFTGATGSVTSYGYVDVGNGWFRIYATMAATPGQTSVALRIRALPAAGSSMLIWGAQVEASGYVGPYVQTTGSSVYGTPALQLAGLAGMGLQTNGSLYASAVGNGNIRLYTNNVAQEQVRVSHTANAVNYVQMTGAATGSGPTISAQGSDTNADLNLTTKGTGAFNLNTGNGTAFRVSDFGGTIVGGLAVYAGSSGQNTVYVAPYGSGAGVNFVLASKGTSPVIFGTNTSNNATASEQFRVAHTASSVNYMQVSGAATGAPPYLLANGSDTDVSLIVTSKGAGTIFFKTAGAAPTQLAVSHTASAVNYVQVTGSTTGNSPNISAQGSDSNTQIQLQAKGTGIVRFATGGGLQAYVSDTASSVNYVQMTGAATGGQVFVNAAGSDSNIGIGFTAKLFANINFFSAGGFLQFQVAPTASAVNYFQATGGATGFGPVLSAQGSDTNIPAVVQPKGTGALQAQQTDSTATGGNARGANAVDLQTVRSSASQVASNLGCVVGGGSGNTASSLYSAVTSGLGNVSNNLVTLVAGGQANSASGGYSAVVGGVLNNALGFFNFMGGGYLNSGTSGSAVTTQSGTMNGTTAVTLSGSNASIKVGQYITGTSIGGDTYVAAISGTSLTLSKVASGSSTSTLSFFTPHGVVVGGGNNTATGSYSFIGGGGDAGTASSRNIASGDWASVIGGNTNTASGAQSVVVGGSVNTANSSGSFIGGGNFNQATSTNAFVGGGFANNATGSYSSIMGGVRGTTRLIGGNMAFPAHINPIADANGVSQAGLLILGRQTTDATATVLTSTTGAAASTNQVILPNNAAYFFTGEIVAGVTGGGNTKGWTIEGVIKRGANAASTALVGTPTVTSTYADAGASTWVIAVTADTTNGGLAVTFTGQLATTIRVVAQIRTTEMTY